MKMWWEIRVESPEIQEISLDALISQRWKVVEDCQPRVKQTTISSV